MAQVTVVVLVPGMGDDVQAIKAGIMEIADIFVINKSDQPGAERMEHEIQGMLSLAQGGHQPPIVRTVATEGTGVPRITASGQLAASSALAHSSRSLARRSTCHNAQIGIIGGSGLYSMPGFEAQEEVVVETPFGAPSDNLVVGKLAGRSVAFLARHGRGHRISPSELNFRANIYAMKSLGVERIISLSAVGSLKEEHRPLDFVIPDQFVDRTRGRISTFFGEGLVAHIGFSDPICPQLAEVVRAGVRAGGSQRARKAARTCAWKARRSPPGPSRTSTEAGAWT